jgi:hypothetical protein
MACFVPVAEPETVTNVVLPYLFASNWIILGAPQQSSIAEQYP